MPTTLATKYLGGSSTAVLLTGGSKTRIYYQSADGSIHEAIGTGPAVNHSAYREIQILPSNKVRVNSPLAAVAIHNKSSNLDDIRLYFIDQNNLIHEFCNDGVGGSSTESWYEGYMSRHEFAAAVNSGVLHATVSTDKPGVPEIRVGYQSAGSPGAITEATNTSDGPWIQATFN